MNQKKLTVKLPREAVQGIHELIKTIITKAVNPNDDEKLLLATLEEIRQKLYAKLGSYEKEYRLRFTTAHAIALRLLYTDYVGSPVSYVGSKLHRLASDIDKWTA